ncbi:MAG: SGNH/GDSL hydrolase family protein [Butyrivibrio sp.]|nr:SGNH/GDSL hydrolase family protein [Butyrivibrio sp.]
MKKNILKFSAIILSLSLLTCACSFSKSDNDESTENSSDIASSIEASDSSASASDSIVVYDEFIEPNYDELVTISENSSDDNSTSEDTTITTDFDIDENCVMVFFGDSQIANGKGDGTDIPSLVSKRVPYSTSINLGIGGTTAAVELTTSNLSDYANWNSTCFYGMVLALEGTVDRNSLLADKPDILENMNKIDPSQVDFYFIEYGANDFFNKIPLDKYGYEGDIDDLHTYYGALCRGIEKLKEISPQAEIILISPFYGIYKDANGTYLGDSYITSNGIGTLADYAKKAKNVTETEEIYYFDTMFRTYCDLYLDTVDQYLMDNLHLNLLGRQVFSRLLAHIPNWRMGYEPYAYLETDIIQIENFNPDEYYRYRDDMLQYYYPEYYEKLMNGEYLLAQPQ